MTDAPGVINWDDPDLDGDMVIFHDNEYNEQNIFDESHRHKDCKINEAYDDLMKSNREIDRSRSVSISSPKTPDLGGNRLTVGMDYQENVSRSPGKMGNRRSGYGQRR